MLLENALTLEEPRFRLNDDGDGTLIDDGGVRSRKIEDGVLGTLNGVEILRTCDTTESRTCDTIPVLFDSEE
jgi:hypothetical protein